MKSTEAMKMKRPPACLTVRSLVVAPLVCGCITIDEPDPPSQDTGAAEPDCNQALQDALDAGLCQAPGELVINFDLGSTDYVYVDDPYFQALGAIGVFGPGLGARGGVAAGGIADSVARVIESNGSCEILCTYDIVTCNDDLPVCLNVVAGCLYCNDDSVTIEQCQVFVNACSPAQPSETSGSSGSSDGSADSTSHWRWMLLYRGDGWVRYQTDRWPASAALLVSRSGHGIDHGGSNSQFVHGRRGGVGSSC